MQIDQKNTVWYLHRGALWFVCFQRETRAHFSTKLLTKQRQYTWTFLERLKEISQKSSAWQCYVCVCVWMRHIVEWNKINTYNVSVWTGSLSNTNFLWQKPKCNVKKEVKQRQDKDLWLWDTLKTYWDIQRHMALPHTNCFIPANTNVLIIW